MIHARISEQPPSLTLSKSEFRWFAELVHTASGIVLGEAKSQLVHSRLGKRVRATGCAGFTDYMKLVANDRAEQAAAVYALTTNHTKFFREDHHFDHFSEVAWPPLAARLQRGERVRLWSAACSSGEEPYSLMMTALGADRAAAMALLRSDLRVLATDLAPHVLATAKAGSYPGEVVAAMPGALARTWVRRADNRCEIDPVLRSAISFRQLNLLGDWPMRGRFDAIFCRNVMIYFDEPTKARLLDRLCEQLEPGGFLYIGHSERLTGPAMHRLRSVGNTIYQKAKV